MTSIVDQSFGSWEAFRQAIGQPDYLTDESNIWASVIALNIVVGYRVPLLVDFFKVLRVQKVLTKLLNATPHQISANDSDGQDHPSHRYPEATLISKWWHASVILPGKIFPLPQDANLSVSPSTAQNSSNVRRYGIGFLQSVRFRLLGYRMGEIKQIENVLAGEIREYKQRQLSTSQTQEYSKNQDAQNREILDGNAANDLVNEVHKTLADKKVATDVANYTVDYGSPSKTKTKVSGNWWVEESPAGGESEDISRFAKEVLNQTADRVYRQTIDRRLNKLYHETEQTYVAKFDNTTGRENIRGVYHWLNKSYQLYLRPMGNRLVIEMTISDPAATFVDLLRDYYEIDLVPPVAPHELGLTSYQQIQTEHVQAPPETGEFYFLTLFQQFGVSQIAPPPKQTLTLEYVIKSEQILGTLREKMPGGYMVKSLTICVLTDSTDSAVTISVGGQSTKYKPSNEGGMHIQLDKVLESLTLSVFCSPPQNSASFVSPFAATVKVQLKCLETHLNVWQLEAYQAIKQGYQGQLEAYYQQVKKQEQELLSTNPKINEELERGQLVTRSIELLRQQGQQLTGSEVDVFRYEQYFKKSLDWNHMLTYLQQQAHGQPFSENMFLHELADRIYFRSFLQAKSVTLLIPVQPDFSLSFLYFMSSGYLWQGKDSYCPVNEEDIKWVEKLKQEDGETGIVEEETWQVTLPTEMSVLNKSDEIPNLLCDD